MLYRFNNKQPVVGDDTYVSELASIIGDVIIGDKCYIGHGVVLRGDYGRIEIGDGTAVEEGVLVHAPPDETAWMGKKVTIGHGAILHGKHIGDSAVIGMGAVISIRSEIGEWSIIAEGTVVKQNQIIPQQVVAAGNPARIVREINIEDQAKWRGSKQLYMDLAKKYLNEGMQQIG
ncbi:gamma carbonic anhydrase family protein [Thermodesulfobacteriota bacterium]